MIRSILGTSRAAWRGWVRYGPLICVAFATGCLGPRSDADRVEAVWGRRGFSDGRFQKPRAITVDAQDRFYIVDMTARIQAFDAEGKFLRAWQTPLYEMGRPTGLSVDRDGNIVVADTHYFRLLFYSPDGVLLEQRTLGGQMGSEPGEFGLVTDAVQDSHGNWYIAEYLENDRIQKLSPTGEFLKQWGGHGTEPGKFSRPQNLQIDLLDRIWVVDACNHRIQAFDTAGQLLHCWGEAGHDLGELWYPYDLAVDDEGHVYVCEYGNNRVQKFTTEGESVACWGGPGREVGQLNNPWGLILDSRGKLHVLDSNNHRVQRITL